MTLIPELVSAMRDSNPQHAVTLNLYVFRLSMEGQVRLELTSSNYGYWLRRHRPVLPLGDFMQCINCKAETNNPKFCGRSCAASYNNRMFPKKIKTVKLPTCVDCGKQLGHVRSLRCNSCHQVGRLDDRTLGEMVYYQHHKSSAFALVRSRARYAFPKCPCEKCGYTKHTEVCHIRPVRDFPLDTKVSVVNARSNLLRLCPNCHWEMDHNL